MAGNRSYPRRPAPHRHITAYFEGDTVAHCYYCGVSLGTEVLPSEEERTKAIKAMLDPIQPPAPSGLRQYFYAALRTLTLQAAIFPALMTILVTIFMLTVFVILFAR